MLLLSGDFDGTGLEDTPVARTDWDTMIYTDGPHRFWITADGEEYLVTISKPSKR